MEQLSQFAHRHWQLSASFAVIFIALVVYEFFSSKKAGKTITTAQAIEQINHFSAVIVDLRPVEIFKKGHIIGAIRATEHDFNLHKMLQHKEKPMILVCPRGFDSQKLVPKLSAQGYTQLMSLEGGIAAWQAANLPMVKK